MAYRRSITSRAKQFYQQQQIIAPPLSNIHRDDADREESRSNPFPFPANHETRNYIQNRFFGGGINNSSSFNGSRNVFRDWRFAAPAGFGGSVFVRDFSSAGIGGGAADNIEFLNDMAGIFVEKAAEVAPAVNEVAIAAADSFYPVAALQYLIEYIHISTGFHWWASIVVTTLLIRTLQLPLILHQLKATSKFTLLRPKLEAIKEEMNNGDMSPSTVADGQARMKKLFKEHGVTPFTPLKGILITAPIFCSFFFAIRNMAEKVPSFKDGGAFWFMDLTAPDTMYIFPVLTALTFWITVECNAQEGLEGNPTAGTIKIVSRVFAALTVPFTASFPQAVFCYWITSNLFSLTYGLIVKNHKVKNLLGIPIITVAPTPASDNPKPGFSFFAAIDKYAAAMKKQNLLPPPPTEVLSKPIIQTTATESTLHRRIKTLEKEVKRRKNKGKKR
ncbi:hypothetical protein ABFS82_01G061500 [Erythranthe guttata]